MRLLCWLGIHAWSVTSHQLGVRVPGILNPAWEFEKMCYRCGKTRRDRHWLPPQGHHEGCLCANCRSDRWNNGEIV